ncbi:MAG: tetratricopeptide repeat protein [Trueperaceae bacterium]|nr:tetratricopeptide repeat protein [Trueperaceae bacterium]
MRDEPEEDASMLGRWSRTARQAPAPEETPPAAAAAATATAQEAPPAPPGVFEVDDEEDVDEDEDMFAYGIRDPLADAEREERVGRRMVLLGALVVATLVFLALQWAVSDAALSGPSPAPYAAGLAAYREGAFVEASRAWHPRAEAGDARAMFMLGYMAEVGQGRPWSNREASEWYRQAAQRGHPQAQARLASLYERGMGVERDLAAALTWYRRAGDRGVADAELAAARLLAGSGVFVEARERLDRAATVLPEAAAWQALSRAEAR